MQVVLYKCVYKTNVANKLLNDADPAFKSDVIPYGAFDPNSASFRLDTLYDVNYGTYIFNNRRYYGYVDIVVDSKGLYNYTITTDPLTTAWYNNCFDTMNICQYSDYGTLLITDPRASVESKTRWITNTYSRQTGAYKDFNYIAMCVLAPTPEQYSGVLNPNTNPGTITYVMKDTTFAQFFQILIDGKYPNPDGKGEITFSTVRFIPSILGVYVIRGYEFELEPGSQVLNNEIILYSVTTSDREKEKVIEPQKIRLPSTYPVYKMNSTLSPETDFYYYTGKYDVILDGTTGVTFNTMNIDAQIHLQIPGTGSFDFTAKDVLGPSSDTILKIGYIKRYDFCGGSVKTILTVNDEIFPDYTLTTALPYKLPIAYDGYITDWNQLKASAIINTVGAIATLGLTGLTGAQALSGTKTIMKTATTAAKAAYVARVKAGSPRVIAANEYRKDIMSAAGNAQQAQLMYGEQLGRGLIGSLSTMAQSFVNLNAAAFREKHEAAALHGTIGGSPDYTELPWVTIRYNRPYNQIDIQSLYGKPDGESRNISTLKGYVQTINCHLNSNGLPLNIITDAETISDSGFRIEQ